MIENLKRELLARKYASKHGYYYGVKEHYNGSKEVLKEYARVVSKLNAPIFLNQTFYVVKPIVKWHKIDDDWYSIELALSNKFMGNFSAYNEVGQASKRKLLELGIDIEEYVEEYYNRDNYADYSVIAISEYMLSMMLERSILQQFKISDVEYRPFKASELLKYMSEQEIKDSMFGIADKDEKRKTGSRTSSAYAFDGLGKIQVGRSYTDSARTLKWPYMQLNTAAIFTFCPKNKRLSTYKYKKAIVSYRDLNNFNASKQNLDYNVTKASNNTENPLDTKNVKHLYTDADIDSKITGKPCIAMSKDKSYVCRSISDMKATLGVSTITFDEDSNAIVCKDDEIFLVTLNLHQYELDILEEFEQEYKELSAYRTMTPKFIKHSI